MTPCGGLVYMLRWLPARYLTWEQYLRHFRPSPHNSKRYAYRAMTFIPPTSLAKRVSKCELVVSAHFAAVHPTQGVLDAASSLGVLIRGNFLSEQLALASPLPSRSLQHVINGQLKTNRAVTRGRSYYLEWAGLRHDAYALGTTRHCVFSNAPLETNWYDQEPNDMGDYLPSFQLLSYARTCNKSRTGSGHRYCETLTNSPLHSGGQNRRPTYLKWIKSSMSRIRMSRDRCSSSLGFAAQIPSRPPERPFHSAITNYLLWSRKSACSA
jgi:hypothetical protein